MIWGSYCRAPWAFYPPETLHSFSNDCIEQRLLRHSIVLVF
uniref:Uncharacterized protein n=1 Tax=Arundo donax TaxID=35708 RepID=A0A0A9BMR0_ARUDO